MLNVRSFNAYVHSSSQINCLSALILRNHLNVSKSYFNNNSQVINMKIFNVLLTILFLWLQFSSFAQSWEKNYTHAMTGDQVFQTTDNGYVTIGDDYPCILTKYNNWGDTLWTKRYNAQVEGAVRPTHDNGYLVVTSAFFSMNPDIYIEKLDHQGDTLWTKIISASTTQMSRSIVQTTDSLYLFAYEKSNALWIVKIDVQGNIIFNKSYANNSFSANLRDLAATTDGGAVTLSSRPGANQYEIVTKLSATGDSLWAKTVSGDGLMSITQTNDGGYIVTGTRNDSLLLVKLDGQGTYQWEKTFSNGFYDIGHHVRQTTDGGYILVGAAYASPSSNDSYLNLIKTTATGDTVWTQQYGNGQVAYGNAVEQTNDGGYIITGTIGFNSRLYLIKTNTVGDLNTNIKKVQPIPNLRLMPNPTTAQINIDLGKPYKKALIEIYTSLGQLQTEFEITNQQYLSSSIDGGVGVYFVKVTANNKTSVLSVIKR